MHTGMYKPDRDTVNLTVKPTHFTTTENRTMAWKSTTGTRANRLQAELRGRAERLRDLDKRCAELQAERQRARDVYDRLESEYHNIRAAEMIGRHIAFTRDAESGPEAVSGIVHDSWPEFVQIDREGKRGLLVVPIADIPGDIFEPTAGNPDTADLAA